MDVHSAIEHLKTFVITHDLPRTDVALYGVRCPYCGKSDRIRELDNPEKLAGKMEPHHIDTYTALWRRLDSSSGHMGVCKFCQNLLRLPSSGSVSAEALDGP